MKATSILSLLLISVVIAGCGEDTSSSKDVIFSHLIEQPVVINADYVINPGGDDEIVLNGPWAPFQYKFENNSLKYLTVAAIEFKIRAQTATGFKTSEATYDTNSTCSSGSGRPFVAPSIAPGGAFIGMGSDCTIPLATDGSAVPEIVILYDLPKAISDINSVTATAIGWFSEGPTALGSEKFSKQTFFTTQ